MRFSKSPFAIKKKKQAKEAFVHRNKIAASHTQKDNKCLDFYEEKLILAQKQRLYTPKMDAIMTQIRRKSGGMHLHSC
ncbi:hypothetical protein RRU01S_07_03060 [Agrobacterium rubi TR3 = NBRC 13261]|uniref:Uncharacterized protein n=1 Tax=Agrobacterium rubi TR3 = NBRC 13261 TaxID=1368415 RepID=A0A081CSY5_9HYPH|nr:hypothetical protein RRU01S_07_03060 [Agrobacterium rubi TR3 = NBRC 13261]